MYIEHNSQNQFYKTIFGATCCSANIVLRIFVKGPIWCDGASMVWTVDGIVQDSPMHYLCSIVEGHTYEVRFTMPDKPCIFFYHFRLLCGGVTYYYGNRADGLGGLGQTYKEHPKDYQITVYDPSFQTPDWFCSSVMYQIFPDRFFKSGLTRSKRSDIHSRKWGDTPFYKVEQFGESYLANDFFGGDLDGITQKLDYLKDLGVGVVYLNPVFSAYSNHRYDTGDYEQIDELLGGKEAFLRLCKAANQLGIRILLDGVFNHTGSDSKYFNRYGHYDSLGAYQSKQSPYFEWYRFIDYPDKYDCWWGIHTLPNVDENCPSYIDYIVTSPNAIVKKWLHQGASGWRLDVADELPDPFLEEMRKQVKAADPDAVILGEVWEDATNKCSYGVLRPYLTGKQLDGVMNYPFRSAIIDYVKGYTSAKGFNRRFMSIVENYPHPALLASMTFLSSHDTERILTVLSDAPATTDMSRDGQAIFRLSPQQLRIAKLRLRLALLLQFTLPGVPSIYYGDEAGLQGYGDPFCRGTYPWGEEDHELIATYQKFSMLRQSYAALQKGTTMAVYGEGSASGFLRIAGDEMVLVLVNTAADHDWYVNVELGQFGVEKAVDIDTGESRCLCAGTLSLRLELMGHMVLRLEKAKR